MTVGKFVVFGLVLIGFLMALFGLYQITFGGQPFIKDDGQLANSPAIVHFVGGIAIAVFSAMAYWGFSESSDENECCACCTCEDCSSDETETAASSEKETE